MKLKELKTKNCRVKFDKLAPANGGKYRVRAMIGGAVLTEEKLAPSLFGKAEEAFTRARDFVWQYETELESREFGARACNRGLSEISSWDDLFRTWLAGLACNSFIKGEGIEAAWQSGWERQAGLTAHSQGDWWRYGLSQKALLDGSQRDPGLDPAFRALADRVENKHFRPVLRVCWMNGFDGGAA